MSAVALISDLMMQSQVAGAAQRAGVSLIVASSPEALVEKSGPEVRLVIVDLTHPGLDPAELLAALRPRLDESAAVLAFGPHVHKAKLDAASEAGFHVLTRGQFHANMESLLRSAGS